MRKPKVKEKSAMDDGLRFDGSSNIAPTEDDYVLPDLGDYRTRRYMLKWANDHVGSFFTRETVNNAKECLANLYHQIGPEDLCAFDDYLDVALVLRQLSDYLDSLGEQATTS